MACIHLFMHVLQMFRVPDIQLPWNACTIYQGNLTHQQLNHRNSKHAHTTSACMQLTNTHNTTRLHTDKTCTHTHPFISKICGCKLTKINFCEGKGEPYCKPHYDALLGDQSQYGGLLREEEAATAKVVTTPGVLCKS